MEAYWTRLEKRIFDQCPLFCIGFIMEMKDTMMKDSTLYAYCLDLLSFFRFLTTHIDGFIGRTTSSLIITDMEKIDESTVTQYLNHLDSYIEKKSVPHTNADYSKARKLSVIRMLFTFYRDKGELTNGAPILFHYPKLYFNEPVCLSQTEIKNLLGCVKTGTGLSEKERQYHNYTCARDLTIIAMFLGTGITCQELTQMNVDDLNIPLNQIRIIRRGSDEIFMIISSDIIGHADRYVMLRRQMRNSNNENALFLSLQGRRITCRAVEKMVRKYGEIAVPSIDLSPQILRDTFGSTLYRKSNNLYLVAQALGVRDISTIKRRYSKLDTFDSIIPQVIEV